MLTGDIESQPLAYSLPADREVGTRLRDRLSRRFVAERLSAHLRF
jgi:hypothetical protein